MLEGRTSDFHAGQQRSMRCKPSHVDLRKISCVSGASDENVDNGSTRMFGKGMADQVGRLGMSVRDLGFFAWVIAIFCISPLESYVRASLSAGYTGYILLVPLVSAYLIWTERKTIFSAPAPEWKIGFALALIAIVVLGILGWLSRRMPADVASIIAVIAGLVLIIAGFVALYGKETAKTARFPLLLLFLMLPLPGALMDKAVSALQSGSVQLTCWAFSFLGIPVLREGVVLTIPGISIEVAKECSGINSTLALLVSAIVTAHQSLRANWYRVVLILFTVPLSIVKNALRITTLTILALKVDRSFLSGRLHRDGGFIFFFIALALLYVLLIFLQTRESKAEPELA